MWAMSLFSDSNGRNYTAILIDFCCTFAQTYVHFFADAGRRPISVAEIKVAVLTGCYFYLVPRLKDAGD